MTEMKSLNGYEIVDAKAREDIAKLQENSGSGDIDLSGYATKKDIEGYTVEYNEDVNDIINLIVINAGEGDINTVRLVGSSTYDFTKAGIDMTAFGSTDNFSLSVENGYGDTTFEINATNGKLNFYHTDLNTNEFKSKTVAFTDDIPKIIPLTQSEYDSLPTKDETTIYIIKE